MRLIGNLGRRSLIVGFGRRGGGLGGRMGDVIRYFSYPLLLLRDVVLKMSSTWISPLLYKTSHVMPMPGTGWVDCIFSCKLHKFPS